LPHVEELAIRYKAKVIFLHVIEYKAVSTSEGVYLNLTDQEFDQAKKQAETHLSGIQGEFREKKSKAKPASPMVRWWRG
jgi:hypothetical protein